MLDPGYVLMVAGMGLVTYGLRWFPLFFLSRRALPQYLIDWLDLIPVAILSAIIVPELFTSGVPRHFDWFQPKSIVAVPTLLFALKTRSLGGTVLVGMLLYWIAGRFF